MSLSPESERRRAENLKRFWEDTDVQELFADIEADLHQIWRLSEVPSQREDCHADVRALDRLKQMFRSRLGTLEYAEVMDTRTSRTRPLA